MAVMKNFVPMVGRGQFDCVLEPDKGQFSVYVKVHCLFEETGSGSNRNRWSQQDKNTFQQRAAASLEQWDAQYRFLSKDHKQVTPYFNVAFVSNADDAHVHLKVPKIASAYGPGGLPICNSYIGLQQMEAMDPHAIAQGMVHSWGGVDIDTSLTENTPIIRNERQRISGLLGELELDSFSFGWNSAAIPGSVRVALANLSSGLKKAPASTPRIPLMIVTYASKTEANPANLAYQRAVAIQGLLQQFHAPNPLFLVPMEPIALPNGTGGTGGLMADIQFENESNAPNPYNIFAHEYGHMIGLPDEYDPLPPPNAKSSKHRAILGFVQMTEMFKTGTPEFGKMTTSMMCKGKDVLKWHYVTALQALTVMTEAQIGDWRIL